MKKPPDKFRRIGLIAHTEKAASRAILCKAASLITGAGCTALTEQATAEMSGLKLPTVENAAALARQVDLLLVFGGDGTILRVAREVAGTKTPIFGINIGGLGFLTAASAKQLPQALKQLWSGGYNMETLPMLEATGRKQGSPFRELALNDLVISRGTVPRLIELEVSVDGEALTRYRCDGLILSSPTGSTAYSLASGGAIVSPNAEVFAITPICPHTLSNRSLIVSLDSAIEVKVISKHVESYLSADGQVRADLHAGDRITIRRSRQTVRLLRLTGDSFFATLRQKLHWSGSNV